MSMWRRSQDPDADLDYEHDWQSKSWLPSGDTIASSEWTCDDDGIELHDPSHTDTTTKVWVRGGDVGTTYQIVNRITTAGGRIDDRTLELTIEDK